MWTTILKLEFYVGALYSDFVISPVQIHRAIIAIGVIILWLHYNYLIYLLIYLLFINFWSSIVVCYDNLKLTLNRNLGHPGAESRMLFHKWEQEEVRA